MYKSHRDTVHDLQQVAAGKHWIVKLEGTNGVRLIKEFNNTTVECMLIRNDNRMYDIQPFTYLFRSKISYFDYSTPENRYARNQLFFQSLFRLLHDANMWDIISNKDTFIQVNSQNNHISGKRVEIKHRLMSLLLDATLVKTRKHATLRRSHDNVVKMRRKAA